MIAAFYSASCRIFKKYEIITIYTKNSRYRLSKHLLLQICYNVVPIVNKKIYLTTNYYGLYRLKKRLDNSSRITILWLPQCGYPWEALRDQQRV